MPGNSFSMIKRILSGIGLTILAVTLSHPQDLVDLAKNEQKRRENLKSRKSIVISNANINSMKAKPALNISPIQNKAAKETKRDPGKSVKIDPSGNMVILPKYTHPDAGKTDSPDKEKDEALVKGSDFSNQLRDGREKEKLSNADQWAKAKEQVELLTLKMNYLKHEFSSMDDMMSRNHLLKQMDETLKKLKAAQKEEELLRKS